LQLTTGWPPKPREQTAIKVVNRSQGTLFLLIFSIATYVRDAGVAGFQWITSRRASAKEQLEIPQPG
jgi:hypothetical protein